MWTIQLPLSVAVSGKKQFIINLNRYRNAHFHVLNKAKAEFGRVVGPRLAGVPRLERCTLEYLYYPGKGNVADTNNVCSVQDKFFADVLVNLGILEDDSREFHLETTFKFGGFDREHPRVDVVIRSHDVPNTAPSGPDTQRGKSMKTAVIITMTPADVEAAIREYLVRNHPLAAQAGEFALTRADDGGCEARVEPVAAAEQKTLARAVAETPQAGLRAAQVVEAPAQPASKLPESPTGATHPEPLAPAGSPADHVAPEAATAGTPPEQPAPETSAPPPPKPGSLFAGFTRPKN